MYIDSHPILLNSNGVQSEDAGSIYTICSMLYLRQDFMAIV